MPIRALHRPVLLVSAIFGNQVASLDWATNRLRDEYGSIELQSEDLPFDQTNFYTDQMGTKLVKRFVAFSKLVDPTELPNIKLRTIELEHFGKQVCSAENSESIERPINIDPGYVTEAKLILATTKDRDHRIYLGNGIYGEITLYYQQRRWNASRWTYPDYQTDDTLRFIDACRTYLRKTYQEVVSSNEDLV